MIGLIINVKKLKYMLFNPKKRNINLRDNTKINQVNNYKYLGSLVNSTKQDIELSKTISWQIMHFMNKIWKCKLQPKLKITIVRSIIETLFLYRSESWTIDAMCVKLEKTINDYYPRMLRMSTNKSWKEGVSNVNLFKSIPIY